MDTRDFVSRAYDSNAFTTAQTSAGYINPEIWNKEVLVHVKANLVVAPLAKQYTDLLNKEGDTLNITIGVEPTAAAAVAESAALGITAYEKTQVVFTPSEYGAAYQLTNKEKNRAFINVMQDMTEQLGYQLALKKDTLCVALLQASAGNTVVANSVVASALASTDTIDFADVSNAKKELHKDKLNPYAIVMGYEQFASIEQTEATRASGLGDTITTNGFAGRFGGLDVFVTTQVAATTDSTAKAIVLAKDQLGVPAFGIAQKTQPYLETEYHALSRYTDVVAAEDYAVKILRANGICTINSWAN